MINEKKVDILKGEIFLALMISLLKSNKRSNIFNSFLLSLFLNDFRVFRWVIYPFELIKKI